MSKEFDQLESQFRRRAQRDAMGLPNLPEFQRGTPPPLPRLLPEQVPNPSQDTFRERYLPFSTDPIGGIDEQAKKDQLQRNRIIRPGTRERFLDPTKVISDIPPSLNTRVAQARDINAPVDEAEVKAYLRATTQDYPNFSDPKFIKVNPEAMQQWLKDGPSSTNVEDRRPVQMAGAAPQLPPGHSFAPEAPPQLPEGHSFAPEIPKTERFLQNVTPEGPISGLISLMRTAGQAAQGRRPDLLTNPENAIPEVVQGGVTGTSARAMGGPRLPLTTPEAPVPPPAPRQLTYQPDFEAIKAAKLAGARTEAKRVRAKLAESGDLPAESTGAPIEMPGPVPPEVSRTMLQPHINSIMATAARSQGPVKALEGALPGSVLAGALQEPPKAAAIAQWLKVYERVELAKFSPAAVSSLALATRNLNSNLGTDITIQNVFNRMKPLSTITRPEE